MKIIHIVSYYPPHMGGMELYVKELAQRTASLGHDVHVYTSDKTGKKSKLPSKKNLKISYLKSIEIGHTPIMPSLPLKLMKNIDNNTIVHLHYGIAYSCEVGMILAKIKKAKIVSHIHIDPSPSGHMGSLLSTYKNIFWKRLLPLSNVVICPTEDYINVAKKYGVKKEKCTIIPCGIDTKRIYKNHISEPIPKITNILFVGRLNKQKGIPRLLRAVKLIQDKYDIILHIVGEGEEKRTIENIIKKENINNVILHGRVPDNSLWELYHKSDIFVLPSERESFGIVLLEAMASGLPIIASDIIGIRNVVKDCSLLVKPNPKNFAIAIEKLIIDEKLKNELKNKGLKRVKKYDWNDVIDKIIKTYKKINVK